MKKNGGLFIHSPAHSRPCSSHFIPPSHRGGARWDPRERRKKKERLKGKKRLEICLSNITPVLSSSSGLSGKAKAAYGGERERTRLGNALERPDALSLPSIKSQNQVHPHTLLSLSTHTHRTKLSSIV